MKSAYELAMERLEKQAPSAKLTEEQRQALAEIDNVYKAKIAEREVFLQSQLQKARLAGDAAEVESRPASAQPGVKRRLHEECEAKKDKIR